MKNKLSPEQLMLLKEILQKKINEFDYTPRGYKEWEKYFKRHEIPVWSKGRLKRAASDGRWFPRRTRMLKKKIELFVDVGDNLPNDNRVSVELHYSTDAQTFLIPRELASKVLMLGQMPP